MIPLAAVFLSSVTCTHPLASSQQAMHGREARGSLRRSDESQTVYIFLSYLFEMCWRSDVEDVMVRLHGRATTPRGTEDAGEQVCPQ